MSIEDKYDEVRQLINIGKEKGYLLYDEVNELLPAENTSSESHSSRRIAVGSRSTPNHGHATARITSCSDANDESDELSATLTRYRSGTCGVDHAPVRAHIRRVGISVLGPLTLDDSAPPSIPLPQRALPRQRRIG